MNLIKIPDIDNKTAWIGIIIFLKLLLFWFFIVFFTPEQSEVSGFLGGVSPDSFTYITPVDEFLKTFDCKYLFPYRMFGYAIPYLVARIFFTQAASLNILIFTQTVFSTFSIYLLSVMSVWIFKRNIYFFITLAGCLSIAIVSLFDIYILTESFSTSSIIVSLYYLFKGEINKNYLLSGLFLTWAVFLKPVCFPLVLFFLIYIFIKQTNKKSIRFVKVSFLFLLPLIIFESIWVSGNLKYNNVLTLTSPTIFLPAYLDSQKHTMSLINFSKAIGEEWENSWFYHDSDYYSFDPNLKTSKFNKRSLIELKKEILLTQTSHLTFNPNTPKDKIIKLNKDINRKLDLYTESVKEEKPFRYYIISSINPLKRVIVSSPTHRLYGNYSTMNRRFIPVRLALDFPIWIIEILFILSLPLIFLKERKNFDLILITSIILYFYLIHTVIFKANDFRYVVPILPLMILVLQTFLQKISDLLKIVSK